MQVTRLRVYPVKSFAGVDVDSAQVLTWGLAGDRRWAVVDPQGQPVTAREANALLGLTATVLEDGGLLLAERDGDAEPMRVAVPTTASPVPVGHSRQGEALPAGAEADAWLSTRLGRPARLVWQPDPRLRAMNPSVGGLDGDRVSLADAAPLLLASESSLAQLDRWTDDDTPPLDMLRFRPNVVVDGEPDAPFAEDTWPFVQLGEVRFRVSGTCDRCVMTTIDPASLVRGKEPIRTLAKHRRWNGKTWFGVWLVPDHAAAPPRSVIAVGDAVRPG
ncbi:MOSC domain-containing protein [Microbacterium sp. CFBP9034]|uniref:MOSC domain-containing protein n=1 Tax=Microbacterium sp. CFBP9034 TaxID=3096540 RepID=UPI002A6A631B|nr:MOSC N-terminal beta barrel domain-containing protein [Microbacterium sp. CFBP9034]MDY0910259.1 MOSC domain-containing protein [Microbacterium sp. CFBP9034]